MHKKKKNGSEGNVGVKDSSEGVKEGGQKSDIGVEGGQREGGT